MTIHTAIIIVTLQLIFSCATNPFPCVLSLQKISPAEFSTAKEVENIPQGILDSPPTTLEIPLTAPFGGEARKIIMRLCCTLIVLHCRKVKTITKYRLTQTRRQE